MLDGTGGPLRHRRGYSSGPVTRQHDSCDAGALGCAENRPEVARVVDAIHDQQEDRLGGGL